jgi:hypothetical protein
VAKDQSRDRLLSDLQVYARRTVGCSELEDDPSLSGRRRFCFSRRQPEQALGVAA